MSNTVLLTYTIVVVMKMASTISNAREYVIDTFLYFPCRQHGCLLMLQPGRKRGTAKAVICVSLAKVEKSKMAGAETESSQSMVDWEMQDWEEVASDKEVEDDWVKV